MEIKMKTCSVNQLPKCLKTDVLNHLKNKTSDNVTTLFWHGYIIDCWTLSDVVQYTTEYHLRHGKNGKGF